MGKLDIKSALKSAEKEGDFFNDYALEIAERTYEMRPYPVLQIGETGWGKTKLARFISSIAKLDFVGVNAYPGMDISQLIGMWRPKNSDGNVEVVWEDGLLTRAIRDGNMFALEEITRLPRKMQGRLLGVLDSENRYYSLPEAGITDIEVNENFWLIATANPIGTGYDTSVLDKALMRRFRGVFNVNQPLCDEYRKFVYEISKDYNTEFATDRANRLVKWLEDIRQNTSTKVNTGEVVQLIRNSTNVDIKQALAWTIVPKYKDGTSIATNLDAHFESEDDWKKNKLTSKDNTPKTVAKEKPEVKSETIEERRDMSLDAPRNLSDQLEELLSKLSQKGETNE